MTHAQAQSAAFLSREQGRALALAAGFTEAGVVALPHAAEERDAGRFAQWVRAGRAGSMHYLERTTDDGQLARSRVGAPFPWARSAIVCFASYLSADAPLSTEATEPWSGWVARYAWSSRVDATGTQPGAQGRRRPSDYHKVLLKRLRDMEARLHAELGEFEARAYVDTGPLVERSLAVAAGLGWTGKNTCLIHPDLGSFGFLAVLLTSLEIAPKEKRAELVPDRCGTCTRCIEACPTHALDVPYQMDATRCIAYLTIEHKGPIAEELMPGIGRQVFGCDICQDVCPWNGKALRSATHAWSPNLSASLKEAGPSAPVAVRPSLRTERMRHPPIEVDPDLEPRPELINPALEWLASLDEKSFEQEFNGSPVRRAGFNGLRRNVAIAMGNSGLARFVPQLEAWAGAADEGLRTTARWALGRLRSENHGPGN